MKKHWIHLFVAVIMVCSVLSACSQNSDKYDNEEGRRQISELGKIIGAKFPSGSKIVYASSSERNNEAGSKHIIYSPTPAEFNRPPVLKSSSENFLKILKKASVIKNSDKLKNKWTYLYEGTVGKGQWSAHQINFETGSYLEVDQVFLYWQTK